VYTIAFSRDNSTTAEQTQASLEPLWQYRR